MRSSGGRLDGHPTIRARVRDGERRLNPVQPFDPSRCPRCNSGNRCFSLVTVLGVILALQTEAVRPQSIPSTTTQVSATLADAPPVLDGRDDEPVWKSAPVVDGFLQSRPSEGLPPGLRTEARVAYDAHNLYVFVRAFDPHPDSIVSLLSRRDEATASDHITLMIDSY